MIKLEYVLKVCVFVENACASEPRSSYFSFAGRYFGDALVLLSS